MLFNILKRLNFITSITTVSEEKFNKTNPEALYRKSGFYGKDIWVVINI